MNLNVASWDRILRAVIGLALIWASYTAAIGLWGYVVGAIALATAVFGFCPAYRLLGMGTRHKP